MELENSPKVMALSEKEFGVRTSSKMTSFNEFQQKSNKINMRDRMKVIVGKLFPSESIKITVKSALIFIFALMICTS